MTDIDELARLAKAATPGPWTTSEYDDLEDAEGHDLLASSGDVPCFNRAEDASYAAAANPAAILALTAEVRRLRADAELWRTEMHLRNDPTVAIMFAGVDNRCVIYRGGVAISAAGTYADAIAAAHPKEGV